MPLYSYQCDHCGYTFDLFKSVNDRHSQKCPQCSHRARKIITPVPVVFKGPGFYVTDNRKSSSGRPEKEKESEEVSAKSEAA